jgi:hypothetical protein
MPSLSLAWGVRRTNYGDAARWPARPHCCDGHSDVKAVVSSGRKVILIPSGSEDATNR